MNSKLVSLSMERVLEVLQYFQKLVSPGKGNLRLVSDDLESRSPRIQKHDSLDRVKIQLPAIKPENKIHLHFIDPMYPIDPTAYWVFYTTILIIFLHKIKLHGTIFFHSQHLENSEMNSHLEALQILEHQITESPRTTRVWLIYFPCLYLQHLMFKV